MAFAERRKAGSATNNSKACLEWTIGIDFGTTFSGVAYHRPCRPTGGPINPDIISTWPVNRAWDKMKKKVPSKVHYGKNGELRWGFDTPEDEKALEWMKLLLLKDNDLPGYLRTSTHLKKTREMLREQGKTPVTVIADYLRNLWQHSHEVLSEEHGDRMVKDHPFNVVLTVPAIFPEYARQRMRKAAEQAGILDDRPPGTTGHPPRNTTLDFISEPEAAAIHVLYRQLSDRPDLKVGDTFIVVDCGGGTVDIISYVVVKVGDDELDIQIEECTKGTGDLCGATVVDDAFSSYFVDQVVGRSKWDSLPLEEQIKTMEDWETSIKPNVDPTMTQRVFSVKMAGKVIVLDPQKLIEVFENSVIGRIQGLVREQLDAIKSLNNDGDGQKTPQFVILCGGFGQCKYLRRSLKKMLNGVDEDIQLLQPNETGSLTAICRGAVLSKIWRSLVRQRKARRSYGLMKEEPWDPKKHVEGRDLWYEDPIRGERMAYGQFDWFIKSGENACSELKCDLVFNANASGLIEYTDVLCATQSPDPPSFFDPEDTTIERLGFINMKFPVAIEELRLRYNIKRRYFRQLEFEYRFEISGDSIYPRVMYNGEEVGKLVLDDDDADLGQADPGLPIG
ncbi:hypothetical protein PG984_011350 [Apiospora sp. TS-2023a]